MTNASLRWTWDIGALSRGAIKRAVMMHCATLGLELDIQEAKSLLSSLYTFKAVGPDPQVRKLQNWVRRMEEQISEQ